MQDRQIDDARLDMGPRGKKGCGRGNGKQKADRQRRMKTTIMSECAACRRSISREDIGQLRENRGRDELSLLYMEE